MKYPPLVVVALALAMASCSPPVAKVEEPPAPPTTPAPTPHPATGAQARAVQLYPDLAREGSVFNRTFRDIYEHELATHPETLTAPEWPIYLARRTAGTLGVGSYYPPRATPTPRPPVNRLELGAYYHNENRNQPRVYNVTPTVR